MFTQLSNRLRPRAVQDRAKSPAYGGESVDATFSAGIPGSPASRPDLIPIDNAELGQWRLHRCQHQALPIARATAFLRGPDAGFDTADKEGAIEAVTADIKQGQCPCHAHGEDHRSPHETNSCSRCGHRHHHHRHGSTAGSSPGSAPSEPSC